MTEVTTGNGVVNTVTTCVVGADSAFDDGVTQYQGAGRLFCLDGQLYHGHYW